MSAHLNGDDDPDAPLRLNKKIIWLGTSSPACRTASGIRPGMKIQDAEAKLGKLKRISLSEIEMRETAEFTRMPKQMTFRVEAGREFMRIKTKYRTKPAAIAKTPA